MTEGRDYEVLVEVPIGRVMGANFEEAWRRARKLFPGQALSGLRPMPPRENVVAPPLRCSVCQSTNVEQRDGWVYCFTCAAAASNAEAPLTGWHRQDCASQLGADYDCSCDRNAPGPCLEPGCEFYAGHESEHPHGKRVSNAESHPGHAAACAVHAGGECSRLGGCLQDGR